MKSLPVAIQRRAVDHKSHRVSVLEGQMPRYIFAIRAGDGDAPERAAELNDDAAALAYACEIVRELMQGLTPADRSSLVKVRDETRPIVFSIPFFAACA